MSNIPFSKELNLCEFTKLTISFMKRRTFEMHSMLPVVQPTCTTPSSQPRMTSCLPILNLKGLSLSRDESNLRPSVREPTNKDMERHRVKKKWSSCTTFFCGWKMQLLTLNMHNITEFLQQKLFKMMSGYWFSVQKNPPSRNYINNTS